MTDLGFDEVTGDSSGSSSDGSNKGSSSTGQVHVKRRFGTKTFYASDGCDVCGKNADVAVKVTDKEGIEDGMDVSVELSCHDHLGEVTNELVDSQFEFELLEIS